VIAQDVGMTAQVLRLVNSAFFGRPVRVSDPLQAIQLLGLNTVKGLVLSSHVFSVYAGTRVAGFSIERLQQYSLEASAGARSTSARRSAP